MGGGVVNRKSLPSCFAVNLNSFFKNKVFKKYIVTGAPTPSQLLNPIGTTFLHYQHIAEVRTSLTCVTAVAS